MKLEEERSSEIIENWIIDKLRKKEIEIRKLLRSFERKSKEN